MALGFFSSIVPNDFGATVYIVEDDFGTIGRAYVETDVEKADIGTTIDNLISGIYSNPVRVAGFNTAERWSQDVSESIVARSNVVWTRLAKIFHLTLKNLSSTIPDLFGSYRSSWLDSVTGYSDAGRSCQQGTTGSLPHRDASTIRSALLDETVGHIERSPAASRREGRKLRCSG